MRYVFLAIRFFIVLTQRLFYVLSFGEWPPFASVAVIVWRGDELLLIRRRDGTGFGLPGGYVRLHETVEAAAVREVREESGLDIELRGIAGILSGRRNGTLVRAVDVVYFGAVCGGSLRESAEGEALWLNPETVRDQIAFDYWSIIDRHPASP